MYYLSYSKITKRQAYQQLTDSWFCPRGGGGGGGTLIFSYIRRLGLFFLVSKF